MRAGINVCGWRLFLGDTHDAGEATWDTKSLKFQMCTTWRASVIDVLYDYEL
jgi:hypothetical protein